MTIWRIRIACWIPKATNTHSGSRMLTAFPWQQWLPERAQCCVVRTLLSCYSYVDAREVKLEVPDMTIKHLAGSCDDWCQHIYGVLKTYPTNILLVGEKWISSAGALLFQPPTGAQNKFLPVVLLFVLDRGRSRISYWQKISNLRQGFFALFLKICLSLTPLGVVQIFCGTCDRKRLPDCYIRVYPTLQKKYVHAIKRSRFILYRKIISIILKIIRTT
jgi:hypothetical protein